MAISVFFAGCTSKFFSRNSIDSQETPTPETVKIEQTPVSHTQEEFNEISYTYIAERDGQNVMDLLEKNAETITENSNLGEMIKGINGIMSTNDQYWSFYINGKLAMQSASKTILKKGDIVEWRFEKM